MTTLIIAHRGASADFPENTLGAFKLAARQGADGIELDVYLTKDGEVIVHHDEDVVLPDGRHVKIFNETLDSLQKINLEHGETMPTLKEVFKQCSSLFKIINVEIKSTTIFTDGIEEKVIKLIKEFKLENKIIISSFNPLCLLRVKRLAPQIPRGYLVEPTVWYQRFLFWPKLCKAHTINLDHAWLAENPKLIKKYQTLQKDIWVWTVNSEQAMKKWINLGAQAIITNYPERLKKIL